MKNSIPPKSFATVRYYSIHAYYLININKEHQAVKFEWEPVDSSKNTSRFSPLSNNGNPMEDELLNRLKNGPIRFNLMIQLAQLGDSINDSTQEWPDNREKICIGTLSIFKKRLDDVEPHVFDPTVVTDGLQCSEDPVLRFRRAAYAESAKRRHHYVRITG